MSTNNIDRTSDWGFQRQGILSTGQQNPQTLNPNVLVAKPFDKAFNKFILGFGEREMVNIDVDTETTSSKGKEEEDEEKRWKSKGA